MRTSQNPYLVSCASFNTDKHLFEFPDQRRRFATGVRNKKYLLVENPGIPDETNPMMLAHRINGWYTLRERIPVGPHGWPSADAAYFYKFVKTFYENGTHVGEADVNEEEDAVFVSKLQHSFRVFFSPATTSPVKWEDIDWSQMRLSIFHNSVHASLDDISFDFMFHWSEETQRVLCVRVAYAGPILFDLNHVKQIQQVEGRRMEMLRTGQTFNITEPLYTVCGDKSSNLVNATELVISRRNRRPDSVERQDYEQPGAWNTTQQQHFLDSAMWPVFDICFRALYDSEEFTTDLENFDADSDPGLWRQNMSWCAERSEHENEQDGGPFVVQQFVVMSLCGTHTIVCLLSLDDRDSEEDQIDEESGQVWWVNLSYYGPRKFVAFHNL